MKRVFHTSSWALRVIPQDILVLKPLGYFDNISPRCPSGYTRMKLMAKERLKMCTRVPSTHAGSGWMAHTMLLAICGSGWYSDCRGRGLSEDSGVIQHGAHVSDLGIPRVVHRIDLGDGWRSFPHASPILDRSLLISSILSTDFTAFLGARLGQPGGFSTGESPSKDLDSCCARCGREADDPSDM